MAPRTDDPLRHDFPAGLAQPALRALNGAGFTRLDQLSRVSEAELKQLHGLGPKGIRLLRSALQARGKSFAEPEAKGKP
jgi:predicted flap endonuclease-1-like 5' DNA nuclease